MYEMLDHTNTNSISYLSIKLTYLLQGIQDIHLGNLLNLFLSNLFSGYFFVRHDELIRYNNIAGCLLTLTLRDVAKKRRVLK